MQKYCGIQSLIFEFTFFILTLFYTIELLVMTQKCFFDNINRPFKLIGKLRDKKTTEICFPTTQNLQ